MVKSKKMSKSTVAIVLLSLLLVLSLILTATGAWFTAKDSDKATGGTLTFGKIGSVEVTASGNLSHKDINGNDASSRELMPGDKVEAGTITLTYTKTEDATEDVWYLIKFNGKYYTLNAAGDALNETEATTAGEFTATTTISFTAAVAEVNGKKLDGTVSGSGSIDENDVATLTNRQIVIADAEYSLAIIQKTNLSADDAFTQLKIILG